MEALNDLLQLPLVEECACCLFYMIVALTSPLWLLCLSLCALGEFPFFRILRSHENIKPGPGRGGILITGASRGYHLELVRQLVEEGWVVYGSSMTEGGLETLKHLAAALEKRPGKAAAPSGGSRPTKGRKGKDSPTGDTPCTTPPPAVRGRLVPLLLDVTDAASIQHAVSQIEAAHPVHGLHALLTAEATVQSGVCEWLTPQDFHHNIQVNYCGTVSVTLALLPLLKRSCPHSRVIHVTPSAGLSYPLLAPLTAACQATHAFTHALRVEMTPQRLHVCAVTCGLGHSRRDPWGVCVEASLLEHWAHLDGPTQSFYGPQYVHEALDALRSLSKENGLRSRHVLSALRHALVAHTPKKQYTVGLDAKFFRPLLRLLPVFVRDCMVTWWTGDALVPTALRRRRQRQRQRHTERGGMGPSPSPFRSAIGGFNNGESSSGDSSSSSSSSGNEEEGGEGEEEGRGHGMEEGGRGAGNAMRRCRVEYEVQGLLGEGAFAVVRLATHRQTKQQVALKILRRKALSTPRALQAINMEIKFLERLGSLHHPHLMAYYGKLTDHPPQHQHKDNKDKDKDKHEEEEENEEEDDEEEEERNEGALGRRGSGPGALILVLEYCPGGDLFDHLLRGGHYSMRDAANTIRQLLLGLQAMHTHGVIHRDVKPENCMFGVDKDTGRPLLKLGDFGLAMFYDRQAKHSPSPTSSPSAANASLAGTPGYMSPEVIQHRHYTDKGDVWGVGVVLWVLLCGSPPFYGKTHPEIFSMILHHHSLPSPSPSPSSPAWRDVSESAKQCVSALLEPDPRKRPSVEQALQLPFLSEWAPVGVSDRPLTHAFSGFQQVKLRARFRALAKVCIALQHARHHPSSPVEQQPQPQEGKGPPLQPLPQGPTATHDMTKPPSSPSLTQQVAHWVLGTSSPTLLSPSDMSRLRREWASALPRGGGGLDLQSFKGVMGRLGKNRLPLERLFRLFDRDRNGRVDFDELQAGLARFRTRGREALTFLFEVLDEDQSGSISRNELASLLIYHRQESLKRLQPHSTGTSPSRGGEADIADIEIDPQGYELTEAMADFFEAFDSDGDGEVTLSEFLCGAEKRPDLVALLLGERAIGGERKQAAKGGAGVSHIHQ